MQLKGLELVGFKSFAQKTRLEFMSGIVAIVGPNGSGKSNITDAIRWILGEQSSTNLRSGKIEDLIFSGTPARPAMSLAYVSIHFDNASGQIPIDYRDVAVSRRVSRDGASEFYINDSRVLLRDIIDLFAKARLGVRGIAVINQGASDVFLRAKPDERREMVEEMLGLKEYRHKKNDAENKLKNTEINLSKAQALLEEIQPHLRFLRRQMTRWGKRSEIEQELRAFEKDYFLRQFHSIYNAHAGLGGRKKELEEQLFAARQELVQRRAKLESTEKAQPELLEKLDVLRLKKDSIERDKAQLVRELGKLEGKLETMRQMFQEGEKRIPPAFDAFRAKQLLERMRVDFDRLLTMQSFDDVHQMVRELLAAVKELLGGAGLVAREERPNDAENIRKIEQEKDALMKKMEALGVSLAGVIREESEVARNVQSSNKAFQGVYREMEAASEKLRVLEQSLSNMRIEEERLNIQLEDLKTRLREAQWEFSELEAALPDYQFMSVDFDIEQKIFKLRREIAAVGEIDEALIQEGKETEGRNTFLTTQIADLEKAKTDLANLTADLDRKIHDIFAQSLHKINDEFQNFFRLMFGGGKARLMLEVKKKKTKKSALAVLGSEIGSEETNEEDEEEVDESEAGIDIMVDLPRKKIKSIEMLSGGERSLVSIAALFALVAVSPPPFLVLDEVDAALDEVNARRFSMLLKDLSKKTQFIVVTHNRVTMEAADALYGVTMGDDGVSKVLSLKFEEAEAHAA